MAKQKGALKISLALGLVGMIQRRKLNKASKNCKKSQMQTLRGILEYAKDSEWGKAHNYAEILASTNDDELVKITPKSVRLRKKILDTAERKKFDNKRKNNE